MLVGPNGNPISSPGANSPKKAVILTAITVMLIISAIVFVVILDIALVLGTPNVRNQPLDVAFLNIAIGLNRLPLAILAYMLLLNMWAGFALIVVRVKITDLINIVKMIHGLM